MERVEDNSMYASHQEQFPPKLNQLKGKLIGFFGPMYHDDATGTKCQQFQGIVVNKISNDPPTVNVRWESMPDVEGFEDIPESEVDLW